jgi:hypothetical protein
MYSYKGVEANSFKFLSRTLLRYLCVCVCSLSLSNKLIIMTQDN